MTDRFLQTDVRVLVAKYGFRPVLHALASLRHAKVEDLETEILALEKARSRLRKKRTREPKELVEAACRSRPEIASVLRELGTQFENKGFLPQLQDVRKFLTKHGDGDFSALKSRTAAFPQILKALLSMSDRELDQLVEQASAEGSASQYSILATEILGIKTKRAAADL